MNQWHALGWTLACEVPLLLYLARRQPFLHVLLVGLAASTLTHPLAWHAAAILSPAEYSKGLVIIEAGVVVAEGLWIHAWLRTGLLRSLGWSLLANVASFLLGSLLLS